MNLLIAGSRGYACYPDFKRRMDKLFKKVDHTKIHVIEGGARGVDRMGRQWAIDNNIPFTTYPADWDTHGKKAGYVRNEQMAEIATHAVIFWDGKSPGTKNMIELLNVYNVKYVVVKVKLDGYKKENHSEN